MQQYYYGKSTKNIDSLREEDKFNEFIFCNSNLEQYDKNKEESKYVHLEFERCTFSKVSFKNVDIEYSKFNHCVFIGCYFKEIKFEKIDFFNCTFIECGFHKTKIKDCEFFFTEWIDTYIRFEELYNNLPVDYNYRKKLCKSMARNCLKNGNITEYKKYFWEEKHSTENQYKEIILRRKDYYKKTYNRYDSLHYLMRLIICKIKRIVWGYGENLHNIIYSAMVVISAFAVVNFYFIKDLWNSLYLSMCNFLTLSCSYQISEQLKEFEYIFNCSSVLEGICGIAFVGLFTSALFREISR